MPSQLLDKFKLEIGRILGPAKRKDQKTIDQWKQLCDANGTTTAERLVQLAANDLLNAGQPLPSQQQPQQVDHAEAAFADADKALRARELVRNLNAELLEVEATHRQKTSQLENDLQMARSRIMQLEMDIQRTAGHQCLQSTPPKVSWEAQYVEQPGTSLVQSIPPTMPVMLPQVREIVEEIKEQKKKIRKRQR